MQKIYLSKHNLFFYTLLCILIILADQVTKQFMYHEIGLGNTKAFLPGFIQFTVVQNTGGAFSIFKQYPVYFKIIGLINIVLFSYLITCSNIKLDQITRVGFVCILGGTTGNLIDRFLVSGVIDFLELQLFDFAIFNLADIFIDTGVVLVLIGWVFSKDK